MWISWYVHALYTLFVIGVRADKSSGVDIPQLRAFYARVRTHFHPTLRSALGSGREYDISEQTEYKDRGLFLCNIRLINTRLVKEAGIKSKQAGERGVSARSVRKVREQCLRKFKG